MNAPYFMLQINNKYPSKTCLRTKKYLVDRGVAWAMGFFIKVWGEGGNNEYRSWCEASRLRKGCIGQINGWKNVVIMCYT